MTFNKVARPHTGLLQFCEVFAWKHSLIPRGMSLPLSRWVGVSHLDDQRAPLDLHSCFQLPPFALLGISWALTAISPQVSLCFLVRARRLVFWNINLPLSHTSFIPRISLYAFERKSQGSTLNPSWIKWVGQHLALFDVNILLSNTRL